MSKSIMCDSKIFGALPSYEASDMSPIAQYPYGSDSGFTNVYCVPSPFPQFMCLIFVQKTDDYGFNLD